MSPLHATNSGLNALEAGLVSLKVPRKIVKFWLTAIELIEQLFRIVDLRFIWDQVVKHVLSNELLSFTPSPVSSIEGGRGSFARSRRGRHLTKL